MTAAHPCDLCTLPDCEHASKACALRLLANRAISKQKSGRSDRITPLEDAAMKEQLYMLTLESRALRSERAA